MRKRTVLLFLLVCALFNDVTHSAPLSVFVQFEDANGPYAEYYDRLTSNLAGAAMEWGKHLEIHPAATLDILMRIDDIATANATWSDLHFLRNEGDVEIWEPRIAHEIRTGIDEQPDHPDGEIVVGVDYLTSRLFYDPDPLGRFGSVPSDQRDAVSMFTHELGHLLGFQGWHDWTTGEIDEFASPFDTFTQVGQEVLFFTGEHAVAEYGDLVPLTRDNSMHVGNVEGQPGDELRCDLMNGVRSSLGQRDRPSRLDLAILEDLGYRVYVTPALAGDFNGDQVVDRLDIDLLASQVATQTDNFWFDLDGDDHVNHADLDRLLGGNFITNGNKLNGDADLDGTVGFADFLILSSNFGEGGKKWSEGDFVPNTRVEFADFLALSGSFGAIADPTQVGQVPEPVGWMLMLAGLPVIRRWRCRR